ncbi:AAA family ATPase [Guggenheimella bovis]
MVHVGQCKEQIEEIQKNMKRVFVGKDEVITDILTALIARGHVLVEDAPGTGKTTLVSALSATTSLAFKRIQFTPDIMPSDVTGFNLYNPKRGDFELQPGAVMTEVLLADEINRTSPKTQSALLEVMQENQVTIDGVTYKLPKPFMVLATQNPVEYLGTYPLPEAQLDRFMMKISLGYPSLQEEVEILERFGGHTPLDDVTPVVTKEEVLWLQEQGKNVHLTDALRHYIARLSNGTRNHPDVLLGVSPRGSLMLQEASKARALIMGRDFVRPEDIQELVVKVFSHRISLTPDARIKGIKGREVVQSILGETQVNDR